MVRRSRVEAVEINAEISVGPSGVQRRSGRNTGAGLHAAQNRNQHRVKVLRVSAGGKSVAIDTGENADQPLAGIVGGGSAAERVVFAHDVSGGDELAFLRRIKIVGVGNVDERRVVRAQAIGASWDGTQLTRAQVGGGHAGEAVVASVLMLTGAALKWRVGHQIGELLVGDGLHRALHEQAVENAGG